MGENLANKILKEHLVSYDEKSNMMQIKMDRTLTQDATGTLAYLEFMQMGKDKVQTELSVSYVDHNTLQNGFMNADDHKFLQTLANKYGIVFSKPGNGICHQVNLEKFAVPGRTMIGSDSHTPTAGGMCMIAIGAGGLDVACAMAGMPYTIVKPKIVGIELKGKLKSGVAAKDLIIHIIRMLTVKGGVNKILEYYGDGILSLTVPERATICNMGAEVGATTSIFPSDEKTLEFMKLQGREKDFKEIKKDDDATYDENISIDLNDIEPLASCPHSPDNVKAVKELKDIKVDQVLIGSCTNSSLSDLAKVASILKGKKVHKDVSLAIAPGSLQVLKMITENSITSLAFNNESNEFYTDANTKSYAYQWLNEDFYDTLYNSSNFIDNTKDWNITNNTNYKVRPNNTNIVSADVGLLNNYEYYNSMRCINSSGCNNTIDYSKSYLNIGYNWRLINKTTYVGQIQNDGSISNSTPTVVIGIRPSIYLKSTVKLNGDGTKNSPYKIVGDMASGEVNDLINTRLSGEYVKLKNGNKEQLFRIVSVDNSKTKIVLVNYEGGGSKRQFAINDDNYSSTWGNALTTGSGTWYSYWNNTYLPNLKNTYGQLFDSGVYYLASFDYDYKLCICASATTDTTSSCTKTSSSSTLDIGLLRYGELFATQQGNGSSNSAKMWTITPFSSSSVLILDEKGLISGEASSSSFTVRPTLYLKSTVKIKSGNGTRNSPYVVGL